jgi:O-antigen/teichoic acid export membrane protein
MTVPMIATPPLRVAVSWTLAGNIVYSGCMWGMVLVLAKLGSAIIVGQFALGMAIATPVFMFTNLQLRGLQATDSREEFEFSDYFALRCLATAIGFAAVIVIILTLHYDRITRTVILLVATAKVLESLSDVVTGLLQRLEKLDQVAFCFILKGVGSTLAFAGIFWRFRNLAAALLAMTLVWLLVFTTYELRRARQALPETAVLFRFKTGSLKTMLVLSLPLGIVMAFGSLYTNIPRYFLEHYMGPRELGIFASLAYLGTSATIVINALGQSVSARLSRMFAEGQFEAFTSLVRKLVLFGILLGVGGVPLGLLLGRRFITLIYRPEYAQHLDVFVAMIATTSAVAVASFVGYAVTSARCFKMPVPIAGASVAATAISSFLLVPRFGLMGAAIALSVASVVQAIGLVVLLNRELSKARDTRVFAPSMTLAPESHPSV